MPNTIHLPSWYVTYIDHSGCSNSTLVKCSDKGDAEQYCIQFHGAKEVKSVTYAS